MKLEDVWFVIRRKRTGIEAWPVNGKGWLVLLAFVALVLMVSLYGLTLVHKTGSWAMMGIVLLALPFLIMGLITMIRAHSLPHDEYLQRKASES